MMESVVVIGWGRFFKKIRPWLHNHSPRSPKGKSIRQLADYYQKAINSLKFINQIVKFLFCFSCIIFPFNERFGHHIYPICCCCGS